jgi:putative membrane protein
MFIEKFVTSLSGLLGFISYFSVSILLLLFFAWIYSMVTPYSEFKMISGGNVAAASSLIGALLGFAIPLASAVSHSVGLIDMMIWGIIALVIQIATFFVVKHVFPAIVADIQSNEIAKGVFLGGVSIVIGILNAACMT